MEEKLLANGFREIKSDTHKTCYRMEIDKINYNVYIGVNDFLHLWIEYDYDNINSSFFVNRKMSLDKLLNAIKDFSEFYRKYGA